MLVNVLGKATNNQKLYLTDPSSKKVPKSPAFGLEPDRVSTGLCYGPCRETKGTLGFERQPNHHRGMKVRSMHECRIPVRSSTTNPKSLEDRHWANLPPRS